MVSKGRSAAYKQTHARSWPSTRRKREGLEDIARSLQVGRDSGYAAAVWVVTGAEQLNRSGSGWTARGKPT